MSSHFAVFSDSDKRIPYSLKIKGYIAYRKTNGTKKQLVSCKENVTQTGDTKCNRYNCITCFPTWHKNPPITIL